MRLKILFLSSWYPTKLDPTNGNFVQRHAEAVQRLHDVEVLHALGDPAQLKKFQVEDNVVNGIRTVTVYYRNSNNSALNFLRRMRAYRKGFAQLQRPQLVHANIMQRPMLFALYLKMRYNIPYLLTEHWSGFLAVNRDKLGKTDSRLAKLLASKASRLTPVSQKLGEDLRSLGLKTPQTVIGNVVDTAVFPLKTAAAEPFTFLHISNLVPLKNADKIVEVSLQLHREFPRFQLQIGGDGDLEPLEKLIKQNNAQNYIETFSLQTSAQVAARMRRSNCFILFSDYENFPCVLLESLSSGTYCIATAVGGIPEILGERRGILIQKNIPALYSAMKKILLEQHEKLPAAELHRFVAENFSAEVIAKKFDKVYREVLAADKFQN